MLCTGHGPGEFTENALAATGRDAHYTPELLLYAWHNRSAVEALERQLADFVADTGKKRASLAPAPKQARHIQHALVDQYGLASQSFGAEPNRYVQVFKVAGLSHAVLSSNNLTSLKTNNPSVESTFLLRGADADNKPQMR